MASVRRKVRLIKDERIKSFCILQPNHSGSSSPPAACPVRSLYSMPTGHDQPVTYTCKQARQVVAAGGKIEEDLELWLGCMNAYQNAYQITSAFRSQ